MPKFFKIFGIVYIVGNVIIFILALISKSLSFLGTVSVISNVVLGMAVTVLGDLMERMSDLESHIDLNKKEDEDHIEQVTCPKCRNKYDMDYPKCPNCGYKNEFLK